MRWQRLRPQLNRHTVPWLLAIGVLTLAVLLSPGGGISLPLVIVTLSAAAVAARWPELSRNPTLRRLAAWRPRRTAAAAEAPAVCAAPAHTPPPLPEDPAAMVEVMLAQGRYTLLLRPQIVGNLNETQQHRSREALSRGMALVPVGSVAVRRNVLAEAEVDPTDDDFESGAADVLQIGTYLLDRFPVTNRQYQQFVDAGGYEQMSLWEPEIWPAVLDFVDTTGRPGPRWWVGGRFIKGTESHAVCGVCWYEAAAYARWVGKRLPTDAEWVKAGAWPVTLASGARLQRKFPWGDSMDRTKANLWGSGPGGTVAVDEFAGGDSVGGVSQLVGNVWEWTADDFGPLDVPDQSPDQTCDGTVLKSVRGGAFDTYFDCQANCQFQSGDHPLARKHNVGFRCAISVGDLAWPVDPADEPGDLMVADAGDEPVLQEAR